MQQPNIDELDIWINRQVPCDGAVKRVHDQHRSESYHNRHLKVRFVDEQGHFSSD